MAETLRCSLEGGVSDYQRMRGVIASLCDDATSVAETLYEETTFVPALDDDDDEGQDGNGSSGGGDVGGGHGSPRVDSDDLEDMSPRTMSKLAAEARKSSKRRAAAGSDAGGLQAAIKLAETERGGVGARARLAARAKGDCLVVRKFSSACGRARLGPSDSKRQRLGTERSAGAGVHSSAGRVDHAAAPTSSSFEAHYLGPDTATQFTDVHAGARRLRGSGGNDSRGVCIRPHRTAQARGDLVPFLLTAGFCEVCSTSKYGWHWVTRGGMLLKLLTKTTVCEVLDTAQLAQADWTLELELDVAPSDVDVGKKQLIEFAELLRPEANFTQLRG